MASAVRGVWAVDIGDNALKALHLRRGEEGPEVIGFDYIEHSKILSGDNVTEGEREDIIAETLHQFVGRNDLGKDEVAISMAGHNSFARFVKLPPVERKIIPKIIPQEAVQQIPFDINEVEWDWQLMESSDSSDVMLGIFAIKNELISGVMERFSRENMQVTCVQIAPMALYNYATYDRKDVRDYDGKPAIILDMGAENTTLVVCTKSGVWQRSIRIGGNAFTEAIAEAFKLKFRKAEKLKRTAPMSKYVRQIFTAMKPVFTDLGSEIQRSLGFYSTSGPGRDKGFSKVIALGGGMKLQGLAKYLQQALGIPVVKPDSFERLAVSSDVSSAKFHENISDFGVVYGLAIQLLGEAIISVNLLPRKIARAMAWRQKSKFFTIAASMLLLVSILSFGRASRERGKYTRGDNVRVRQAISSALAAAESAGKSLGKERSRDAVLGGKIKKQMGYFKYRDVVPLLNQVIITCLPNAQNNPEQAELYNAFSASDVSRVVSFPRGERKQLFVTGISVDYAESLAKAQFSDIKKTTGQSRSSKKKTGGRSRLDRFSRFGGGRFDPRLARRQFLPPTGRTSGARKAGKSGTQEEKDGPGFLVVMEGYSSYKNIDELMDPPGVGKDQSKWGLVTRFENLSTYFDNLAKHAASNGDTTRSRELKELAKFMAEGGFELYEKENVAHFECKTDGEVEIGSADMPGGIGVEREIERIPKKEETTVRGQRLTSRISRVGNRVSTEKVLVDPMTDEEMSKTFDLVTQEEVDSDPSKSERDLGKRKYTDFGQPKYIVRDHWFRIKAKFLWKGAAKPEAESGPKVITYRKG